MKKKKKKNNLVLYKILINYNFNVKKWKHYEILYKQLPIENNPFIICDSCLEDGYNIEELINDMLNGLHNQSMEDLIGPYCLVNEIDYKQLN